MLTVPYGSGHSRHPALHQHSPFSTWRVPQPEPPAATSCYPLPPALLTQTFPRPSSTFPDLPQHGWETEFPHMVYSQGAAVCSLASTLRFGGLAELLICVFKQNLAKVVSLHDGNLWGCLGVWRVSRAQPGTGPKGWCPTKCYPQGHGGVILGHGWQDISIFKADLDCLGWHVLCL